MEIKSLTLKPERREMDGVYFDVAKPVNTAEARK